MSNFFSKKDTLKNDFENPYGLLPLLQAPSLHLTLTLTALEPGGTPLVLGTAPCPSPSPRACGDAPCSGDVTLALVAKGDPRELLGMSGWGWG